MTVVISHSEYQELREDKSIHHLGRETSEKGVHKYLANYAGGVISWQEKVTEWGEHTEIKRCANCGKSQPKHSPPVCFSCATGRN